MRLPKLTAASLVFIVMVTSCSISQVDLKESEPAVEFETNFSVDEVRACLQMAW